MYKHEGNVNKFRSAKISEGMRSRKQGYWLKRFFTNRSGKAHLAHYLAALFALLIALIVLFIVLAKAERGVQDPYNRTIGLRKIINNVLRTTALTDIRVCTCQPDQIDRVLLVDRFETTFFIYDRGGSAPRPGIVLIHGNVWMGQRLSTYRLVAKSLADAGFIVLTFDQIGFGESDDPFGQGPAAVADAYDHVSQAEEAVTYLIENTDVDPDNITLLGHSGGVTVALELGKSSDRIANVVIWPAPYAPADESAIKANLVYLSGKFEARYELLYGRSIPDWFEWEMTGIEEQDPDVIWEYYRMQNHKPLILVLGEHDEPAAHPYVIDTFESLAEPKDLVFVSRADHYLNTAQTLHWVFYDRIIVRELVDSLVASLDK